MEAYSYYDVERALHVYWGFRIPPQKTNTWIQLQEKKSCRNLHGAVGNLFIYLFIFRNNSYTWGFFFLEIIISKIETFLLKSMPLMAMHLSFCCNYVNHHK